MPVAGARLEPAQVGLEAEHDPLEQQGRHRPVRLGERGSLRLGQADEPTGNLDSAATTDVLRLFDQLRATGQTLITVTHDSRVAATADRLISMRDGAFVDETRLTGGTSRSLTEITGLGS